MDKLQVGMGGGGMNHDKYKGRQQIIQPNRKRGTLDVSNYYKWMLRRDGKRPGGFSKYLSAMTLFFFILHLHSGILSGRLIKVRAEAA